MLRAAAHAGSNLKLDWDNLAEEIEDLGMSQRSAVGSYIMRIIQHLVKLDHSPAVEPRNGWRRTIRQARAEIDRILQKNPSLRREIPHLIEDETQRAVELAIRDLEEYDEIDRLNMPSLRRASFSEEQVLGDWFAEDPRG